MKKKKKDDATKSHLFSPALVAGARDLGPFPLIAILLAIVGVLCHAHRILCHLLWGRRLLDRRVDLANVGNRQAMLRRVVLGGAHGCFGSAAQLCRKLLLEGLAAVERQVRVDCARSLRRRHVAIGMRVQACGAGGHLRGVGRRVRLRLRHVCRVTPGTI